MDNLSRTKKNSELYEKLHMDSEQDISSQDLSRFANRLHEINNERFEAMEPEATSINAIHARRDEYLTSEPAAKQVSSFNNEYLDEFINEVRQYNIKKGIRTADDTQTNILRGIRKDEPAAVESGLKKDLLQHPIASVINETISSQMQEMIHDEVIPVSEPQNIDIKASSQPEPLNDSPNQALMEETQKLRKQIEDHDNELNMVNDQVSNTNRILNFVLVLLFLTLLVALACLAYYLLMNRGII
ncbi:MAG: hypothetical protein VB012_02005 [Erysipelotrichaceae bacterium]|nr:hypothetical protein [Erysipelotrichaceae bacterium]